jgi:putative molybdopterin biosynthesis protein
MRTHEVTGYGGDRSPLLSINDLAQQLKVSRAAVYRMVRRGELRPYRVGKRLRFDPVEIDELLERSREAV